MQCTPSRETGRVSFTGGCEMEGYFVMLGILPAVWLMLT